MSRVEPQVPADVEKRLGPARSVSTRLVDAIWDNYNEVMK